MSTKKVLLVSLILLIVQQGIFAQPGNPSPGPVGGVVYLLLAALGLGIFTLRKKKNHQQ